MQVLEPVGALEIEKQELKESRDETKINKKVPQDFLNVINVMPAPAKFYVFLGMMLGVDLLTTRSEDAQRQSIQAVAGLSILERLKLAFQAIFGLELALKAGKLVINRPLERCELCGGPIQPLAQKFYGRLSESWLADLGIREVQGWFDKRVYIQCWQCQNTACKKTVGAVRRKDLPYAITSADFLDWMYRAYLGTGASLRAVTSLAHQLGRAVSPTFLWTHIQRLGRLFFQHLDHCLEHVSGVLGTDEVFPRTIRGKTCSLGAIDQQSRLVVHIFLRRTVNHKTVLRFFQTLATKQVTFHTIVTDLRNIYPKALRLLGREVRHVGCILHIYRHLHQYVEKGLAKIAQHADVTQRATWTRQLEAFQLSIEDIFHSAGPETAQQKLLGLLAQEERYGINPGLRGLFGYLRRHQAILIHTLYTWAFLIHNNPIERFFGHIRHKLKTVRGWKTSRTLLYYVRALAIYRNFLQLQKLNATVSSHWTGQSVALRDLTFAEYLQECFPDAGVGSGSRLPVYQAVDWELLFTASLSS